MDEEITKREGVFISHSINSTNRFIQSLKSPFNYLAKENEDDECEC